MLILASRSPRRSELLRAAGFRFHRSVPMDVDESVWGEELPGEYVRRLAEKKALAVDLRPTK